MSTKRNGPARRNARPKARGVPGAVAVTQVGNQQALLINAGALQGAIFNSARISIIATDEKGVIQIFNAGAELMFGYKAAEVLDKVMPADLYDLEDVNARGKALSAEFGKPIATAFEALAYRAALGVEDTYELNKIRKDGTRFPGAVTWDPLESTCRHASLSIL